MKILLIDDETHKLKSLNNLLNQIEGIAKNDISYEIEINSAKSLLRNRSFDLMILDLNMPEILGEEPKKNAGADFIDEILEVENYNIPKDIIILTSYDELEKEFKMEKIRHGFMVLKFDESSLEWKNILESRVKFILMQEIKNANYECDFAIVTAVDVETIAVKNISNDWEPISLPDDPFIYHRTYLEQNGKIISIVTSQQSEMGMTGAATLTSKMIQNFNPSYIFTLGITAGIGKGMNYGDIVVPSEIWNYSSGKYSQSKKNSLAVKFTPEPKSIPLNTNIREIVHQDFSKILKHIKHNWSTQLDWDVKLYLDPMACGTAVIASKDLVQEQILDHSRKTCALDMESYGVFYASANFKNSGPIPICIKSVADFATIDKDDRYQPYAAYTSVQFAKHLIETTLLI